MNLFDPVRLGPTTLRNRTIRAAAFEGMCPGNRPSPALLDYHRSVAAGGVGMTTVAYAAVEQSGLSFPHQLWLRPDEHTLGWTEPGITTSGYIPPFETWASMPQTLWAEEWGMVGALALMALNLLIIAYGLLIAMRCRHQFGRLLAGGITVNFFLYVFVNIAMNMGLIPVGGVPLPLVSHGGSRASRKEPAPRFSLPTGRSKR